MTELNREDYDFIKYLPETTYGTEASTEEGVDDLYDMNVEDYFNQLSVKAGIPMDILQGQVVGLREPEEWDYDKLKDLLGMTVDIQIKGIITELKWHPEGTATITLENGAKLDVNLAKLQEVMES